jgi:hypothetical protein
MEASGLGMSITEYPPCSSNRRNPNRNKCEWHDRPSTSAQRHVAHTQGRVQPPRREFMNCDTHDQAAKGSCDIGGQDASQVTTLEQTADREQGGLADNGQDQRRSEQERDHRNQLARKEVLTVVHQKGLTFDMSGGWRHADARWKPSAWKD